MKKFITYLSLTILFIIGITFSFAQQNQNTQKSDPEVEVLKKRISELESKLQTVESVEKMELAAKLADAQAKLANAEFGKLERELRDSNQKWLIGWIVFFLTVLAVVGTPLWLLLKSGVNRIITNLKSNADQLIADSVEKSLNGFKEAVEQLNVIKNQLRVLQKEHAVSVLDHFRYYHPDEEPYYREQIALLPEDALLQVLSDKTRDLQLRHKAAEVLADRKSSRLVSPVLELLNSFIDDSDIPYGMEDWAHDFVNFVGQRPAEEAYQGLKKFLNRLLNDDTGLKAILLIQTAVSLARVGGELNKRDSIAIIRKAIPDLEVFSQDEQALKDLVACFDTFNEPEGIKDILTNGIADMMPEVETQCLELLQKHDPEFVNEWRAQKEIANTQNKESS